VLEMINGVPYRAVTRQGSPMGEDGMVKVYGQEFGYMKQSENSKIGIATERWWLTLH